MPGPSPSAKKPWSPQPSVSWRTKHLALPSSSSSIFLSSAPGSPLMASRASGGAADLAAPVVGAGVLALAQRASSEAHVLALVVVHERLGDLLAEVFVPAVAAEVVAQGVGAEDGPRAGAAGDFPAVAVVAVAGALERLLEALAAQVGVLLLAGELVEHAVAGGVADGVGADGQLFALADVLGAVGLTVVLVDVALAAGLVALVGVAGGVVDGGHRLAVGAVEQDPQPLHDRLPLWASEPDCGSRAGLICGTTGAGARRGRGRRTRGRPRATPPRRRGGRPPPRPTRHGRPEALEAIASTPAAASSRGRKIPRERLRSSDGMVVLNDGARRPAPPPVPEAGFAAGTSVPAGPGT